MRIYGLTRIYVSVILLENAALQKPVFLHILRSVTLKQNDYRNV